MPSLICRPSSILIPCLRRYEFTGDRRDCSSLLNYLPSLFVYSSLTNPTEDPCDPRARPDPRTPRSDQLTVLINGYSESRIPLLWSISATYSASPLVSSVLILWGNPSTPDHILTQFSQNLSISSLGSASISLIRQRFSYLNARFLPRSSIDTHAVLICDDDVLVDHKSFEFAFHVWASSPNCLIGLFARSHDLNLTTKEWIYTVHPDRYSIILTKFMMLRSDYLYSYGCEGGAPMAEMRRTVDEMRNCEDILMNFVVADRTNVGPMLVGAERVKDYGDATNDDEGLRERRKKEVRDVGLSSRRGEHRKRRGSCIREFHRLTRKMPLRYSFGKLVRSVSEQGLCQKGGEIGLLRSLILTL